MQDYVAWWIYAVLYQKNVSGLISSIASVGYFLFKIHFNPCNQKESFHNRLLLAIWPKLFSYFLLSHLKDLNSWYYVFYGEHFHLFLIKKIVSTSLLKFLLCLCMLCTLSTRFFGIFVIVILKSLADNTNICVMSKSYIDCYFLEYGEYVS